LSLFSAGVGKHRATARCRSVKKLLPVREEPRPIWSKSDFNDLHKKHTAGAIDYHNP